MTPSVFVRRAGGVLGLAAVAFLLASSAMANEAQGHICNVGLNLGQAEARLYLFGRAFGGASPPGQDEVIATHLANAVAEVAAAEALFQEPFFSERARQGVAARLIGKINAYAAQTARSSYRHQAAYVKNLYGIYSQGLQYTYLSSRPDAFSYAKNCDVSVLDYCYHYGRATIAAAITDRDFARSYQSGANGGLTLAMDDGLAVAMDDGLHRPFDGHRKKICCTFALPTAWDPMPGFQPDSSLGLYRQFEPVMRDQIIRPAVDLDPVCETPGTHAISASGKLPAPARWAAVAWSDALGTWAGRSWKAPTQERAKEMALSSCRKERSDCRVVATFSNCAALAQSSSTWRLEWSDRIEDARANAMKVCRRDSGLAQCELRMTVCADGSNRWKKDTAVVSADPEVRPTPVPITTDRPAGPETIKSGLPDLHCPATAPLNSSKVKTLRRTSIPLRTEDRDHGHTISSSSGIREFECPYRVSPDGEWNTERIQVRWYPPGAIGRRPCGGSSPSWMGFGYVYGSETRSAEASAEFRYIDHKWAERLAREWLRKVEPYAVPCE